MKIVFEMADVDYENKDFLLQALDFEKAFFFNDIMENCVPLPKGHGRLIDADVAVDGMEDDYEYCEAINATPAVIEADKEMEGIL